MAVLSDEQLHAIREIIRKHHQAFTVNTIGPDSVPPEVLEELQRAGIIGIEVATIEDAYIFGQVMAAGSNPDVADMSLKDFRSWLVRNPIPLTTAEKRAIEIAQHRAAQYAVGLGNRVETQIIGGKISETIIQAERSVAEQLRQGIRRDVAENIARRESIKSLVSDLKWMSKDWARDWDRIAITEKHTAMQEGVAHGYAKKYGADVLVAVREMPDACKHCKRLHNGPDGQPRIFPLSVLEANGRNVGRKAKDWLPGIPPIHPFCQGQIIRVPNGWGFDATGSLVPGGELGERYGSAEEIERALQQEDELRKGVATGHVTYQGISIAIETAKGETRKWTDAQGNQGETLMRYDYGYVKRTSGDDGEEIDCYVGPNADAATAFLVHQLDPATGVYDEAKLLLGFLSAAAARVAFQVHRNDSDAYGGMSSMDIDQLRRWLSGTAPKPGHDPNRERHVIPIPSEHEMVKGQRHPMERFVLRKAGPFIGPRGGKWADAKHTIHWDPKKHGAQQLGLFSAPADKPKPKRKPIKKSLLRIVDNEPTLTPAQKNLERTEALKAVMKNPKADPKQWELPAGARVNDPWEPKPADPKAKWSHPDYGSGIGEAPWQKGDDWHPDLHSYDRIVVNSSAGKDSQAMLAQVVELADRDGYPRKSIVVVHADLGRAEWEGTKDLAREQAEHYGLTFEVVQREKDDLIEQIEARYGDLMQKQVDTQTMVTAGVKTWRDLAALDDEKLAKILGEDKGLSQWSGTKRAAKLMRGTSGVQQKFKTANNKHQKAMHGEAERAKRWAVKAEGAKSERARTNAKAKATAAADKLKALQAMGDVWDWPIDYGRAIAWPSSSSRYCTADHKRVEVDKLLTRLAGEVKASGETQETPRILNALGIRAQESDNREAMQNFARDKATRNQVIDDWFPIHHWHEQRVWSTIEASGVPYHKAYDLGMRRLSCVFCVFATKDDLMLAAKHNPALFNTYLELEEKVGSSFKADMSLADVRAEIRKRQDEGYNLNDQAEWVKKSLGIDVDDALVKAALAGDSKITPTMVGMVLEAALQRLVGGGHAIEAVALEWKVDGACVHLESAAESHHVEYLDYPEAYNASMVVAFFAQVHHLQLVEHNAPPPVVELRRPRLELSKALPKRTGPDLMSGGRVATEQGAMTSPAIMRNPGHGTFPNFIVMDGNVGRHPVKMHPALEGWDPGETSPGDVEMRRIHVDADDYQLTIGGKARQPRQDPRPVDAAVKELDSRAGSEFTDDIEALKNYWDVEEPRNRGVKNRVHVEDGVD